MQKILAFLIVALSAGLAHADLPDPEVDSSPNRVLTLNSVASLPGPLFPKHWEVYAAPGVIFDRNINHLLINSTINSNKKIADTALHTEAGASYAPDWSRRFKPFFEYSYERFDYQNNPGFSFYDHQLYGAFDYWMTRRWALDLGTEANWYADETGLVTDDQSYHSGLRWRHRRSRMRFGYVFRKDNYIFTLGKNSHANSGYLELSHTFRHRQTIFASYYYRKNSAEEPIYSYQSHSTEVGWTQYWTNKIRTVCLGSYTDKPYDHYDDRFGAKRHEKTFGVTLKPSYAFYPTVRLIGIYSYLVNRSNVDTKSYIDQIYTLKLEARF